MLHAGAIVPATAVGAAVRLSIFVDVALAQGPLPVAVSVRITEPVSPAPGVYVAVVNELAFVIVPAPLCVQLTALLLVADEPAVILIAPALLHAGAIVPATAVGAAVTLTITEELLVIRQDGLFI